jgi:hypothetical protein
VSHLRSSDPAPQRLVRSMMVLLAVALTLPCSMSCVYRASSFHDPLLGPFPGVRSTVGCLDVAMSTDGSAFATRKASVVVVVSIGNRCDHRERVIFPALRFWSTDDGGHSTPLEIFDPQRELRSDHLDAAGSGRESLELRANTAVNIASVCVDISAFTSKISQSVEPLCIGGAP